MFKHLFAAIATLTCLAFTSAAALADDHSFTEGTIISVTSIRTADGKFDDYMRWLATTWKKKQEAAKKAGYIVRYEVLTVEPRGPDDPDLYLAVTYKNWAAMDGQTARQDLISKQIQGSLAAASQSDVDLSKISRVLGWKTLQTLDLK